MDGCFDLMHYGHANALRQAKLLGDQLIVGVVSDEEIVANKGPPVLSMEESGLKWVDEVIPNAPYEITEDFMNSLFNKYNIDYIIHGDDPCLLPDGTDAYALAKKVGRYKQIKRTEGVSSTDIVGRILLTFKQKDHETGAGSCDELKSSFARCSCVVYIDGAFDLFHAGHVEILRSARQLGDFLLVGIHDDQAISHYWRTMGSFEGYVAEGNSAGEVDPYAVPKSMGIF
ncbi:hypothetical protein PR202_ga27613 [Eleusine coracana subsp. coracana]|uniref:ethanolamine-phosphate cytidylyltransferase n=1 Tax=Eleusine coracana subsp. coracana TaxID=191504 RepID=A0AAV5DH51_ELECO|nr:hypothetical protein PR202_ga27591 [Eleusine coracana subsp. coracana]GJN09593.1 hypothetical protein PR202_ga27613 [Eleusine coracana subsp. coracana]